MPARLCGTHFRLAGMGSGAQEVEASDMTLILPFHLCRACHEGAGTWSLKRRGRKCQLGGCFGCGREEMLFCFAPERQPTGRKVTKPPPDAITASVDIPSRQIKDWPAGMWFGSVEVITKGK